MTQPSLTRAIQKLEEEFGGELFRRERALTHLTDLGRMMLPFLERAHEAAQAAKNLAKGVGKATVAPLTLGVAAVLRGRHLNDALEEVGGALPGFQLKICTGDAEHLLQDLLKGDLDVLILAEPRDAHERLDVVELFRQLYAVAARSDHMVAVAETPALDHLSGIGWVELGGDVCAEFREVCMAGAVEPDFRHRAGTAADAAQMVEAGLGCALLPRDQRLPDGVVFVEVTGLEIARRVVLATVAGRRRAPAADAFIRAIKARGWREASTG